MRFFDRREFFSVHGEAALMVARRFYRTTAVVKYMGGGAASGLPSVTLNRSLFEGALRELLVEGSEHTAELWEGSGAQWRVARRASPGMLAQFEEELVRSSPGGAGAEASPRVAALHLRAQEGETRVGLAFLDAQACQAWACEFPDDEGFSLLEAALLQAGVRELALCEDAVRGAVGEGAVQRLRQTLAGCGVLATGAARADFAAGNLEQDLGRLVRSGNAEHHRDVLDRPGAAAALAALLAFSQALADSASYGKWALALYDPGRYMRLDAAALRALNVMRQRDDANDGFSLYGLLAKGRTAMSKRLVKTWLKQPLLDLEEVRARHDVVEALVEDPLLRGQIRDQHLRGLPDVERLARKLERKKASLQDLCMIYRASGRLPLIEDAVRAHQGPHAATLVARFAEPLAVAHDADHLARFEELLESAVDLDRIPDEYLISPQYSEELGELQEQKAALEGRVEQLAGAIAADLGLQLDKTLKLEWHRTNNQKSRCVRITQKEERAVRKSLQAKYLVLETRKDGTKFTNRQLRAAAEELNELCAEYDRKQRELVQSVVDVAASYVEVVDRAGAVLAELDALAGFAEMAANAPRPFVRPEMRARGEGRLALRGSRHPCVEAQNAVDFIPNDCEMVRGESWFQVITGPNMGGKSTFIRQVGVNVLMAQVGSFVACDAAEIPVRDAIFARVGAGDSQLRGVSTFMAEMLETAAILKGATADSLIIVDELGRGTSTYDGLGLAWAISEHLMKEVGAPTLFATHFHELTAIEGPGGVRNRHVETALDRASGKLTMLYQVRYGPCDQSFGIHVAEFANFPPEVVAMARQKALELEEAKKADEGEERGAGEGAGPEAGTRAMAGEGEGEGAKGGAPGLGKRKRVALEDAKAQALVRARAFLQDFAAVPLDKLSQEEALRRGRLLREALQADAATNEHLAELLRD